MKIAILTTDNREAWKKYGLPAPLFGPAPEALLQGFAAVEPAADAEVHVVSCVRKPVASPVKLADNVYYHSVEIPAWGMMKSLCLGAALGMRKKLRQIQPDIVHGQGTECDCSLSAVLSGFPNVLTIHGNMSKMVKVFPSLYHWLAAKSENYVLPRSSGVFCNSTYTQELVAARARNTWLVPNAIRQIFFTPMSHRQQEKIFRFVNVGTISEHKRQMEILSMFAELHHGGVPVKIDFIGTCDAKADYGRRFLEEIGKAEQAGFARYLGTREVDGLIAEMDVADAMLHSPSEEAFGLVVAEALARGLKLFGVRTGGIPDVCRDADGVELYETNDWRGLADGIRRWVAQDAGNFTGYADNQTLMCSYYHPLTVAKKHLEIYREVLEFGIVSR